ncbi:MAG: T9SS type A sorting domain-containing protein [Candidatus Kapaibacterium sp.]
MRLIALIIAISISLPGILFSRISFDRDTITGNNTNDIELNLNIEELTQESKLEFDLIISNPSVCVLRNINTNEHILSSDILNDVRGKYSFKIIVTNEIETINILGELLSGNDDSCTISLENVLVNGVPLPPDTLILTNTLVYGVGPYLRFLYNSAPYPNPVKSGEISTITIFNDKNLTVDVYVYDVKGQPYDHKKIEFKKGENNIEIITEGYSAGTYYITGFSELGDFFEKIVVYK